MSRVYIQETNDVAERREVVFQVSAVAPMHNQKFGVVCRGIGRSGKAFRQRKI